MAEDVCLYGMISGIKKDRTNNTHHAATSGVKMIAPTLRHQGTAPKSQSIDDAVCFLRSEPRRCLIVLLIAIAATKTPKEDLVGGIASAEI